MSIRRVLSILVVLLLCAYFAPSVINHYTWSKEAKKALKAQIVAAPLVDKFRYNRGGYIQRITDHYLYYAYSYSSQSRTEYWVACVDRRTKSEIWFRSVETWRSRVFLDGAIIEWWNTTDNDSCNLEWIDPTTGESFRTTQLKGKVRQLHAHSRIPEILVVEYTDQADPVYINSKSGDTAFTENITQKLKNPQIGTQLSNNNDWGLHLKDRETGYSYFVNYDWNQLILRDSKGETIFTDKRPRRSSVMIIGGLLIWSPERGRLYNVHDLATGAEWLFSFGFGSELQQPGFIQVWGNYLLHGAENNILICRDRQTGHIIWQYPLANKTSHWNSYFVIKKNVVLGINGSAIYSFDLNKLTKNSNLNETRH